MSVLTIEAIKEAASLLSATPKEGFYACEMFPEQHAIGFRAVDGEVFRIAHPHYWRAAVQLTFTPDFKATPFDLCGLNGVPVIDLDLNPVERKRVMLALAEAIQKS